MSAPRIHDLGKAGYWGPQTKGKVDFHFDETRTIAEAEVADWDAAVERSRKHKERRDAVRLKMKERARDRAVPDLSAMACGGGKAQMQEPAK